MIFALLFLSVLLPQPAGAARVCRPTWNDEGTVFGGTCDSMGIRNSAGRSVVSMGEILRVNPAVLPTLPTPLGAELNLHNRGFGPQKSRSEFHVIKGFRWLGLGLGSWNTGSMVGSDLSALFDGSGNEQAFQAYQSTPPSQNGFRLGAAFQLPFVSRGIMRVRAGISTGKGKVPGEESSGIGGVLDLGPAYFSVSKNMEKLGYAMSSVDTVNYAVGVDSGVFHLGYTYAVVRSNGILPASSFLSVRYTGDAWTYFASFKSYSTFRGGRQYWPSATIHRNFGDHFTAGYLYGLYRDSHSLSLQVFL